MSSIGIAPLFKSTINGNVIRALRVEDVIQAENPESCYIHLENGEIFHATREWYEFQAPHVGGYVIFPREYKTSPVKRTNVNFISGAILKNSYSRFYESPMIKSAAKNRCVIAASYASDYEVAVKQAEKRIIDAVQAWEDDDGTKYPEDLSSFLQRLRNGESL